MREIKGGGREKEGGIETEREKRGMNEDKGRG